MYTPSFLKRALPLLGLLALAASPARADDTRPPVISNVNASQKGGKVTVTARITDDTGVLEAKVFYRRAGDSKYDEAKLLPKGLDEFSANFNGSGGLEYYLTAVDELGNGPSKYGDEKNPKTLGGQEVASDDSGKKKRRGGGRRKKSEAVAQAETQQPAEGGSTEQQSGGEQQAPAEQQQASTEPQAEPPKQEEAAGPPTIEHEKPADAKEGEATTLAVKITGNKISTAKAFFRRKGEAKFPVSVPLTNKEGDQWEAAVPPEIAKGTIEYIFTATDEKGQKAQQGDGAPNKPYALEFGKGGAAPKPAAAAAEGEAFAFAHKPVMRTSPGVNITIRAQVTPDKEENAPSKMVVLLRDAAGTDKEIELQPDESGGIGGFQGQIPAPGEGALYYQVVACNKASKCLVDTGSKKSWHPVAVSNDAEAKLPDAIDAVSSKAPSGLPE